MEFQVYWLFVRKLHHIENTLPYTFVFDNFHYSEYPCAGIIPISHSALQNLKENHRKLVCQGFSPCASNNTQEPL